MGVKRKPAAGKGWIVRASARGGFHEAALVDGELAFAWRDMGDLSSYPNGRASLRAAVAAAYPDLPTSQLPSRISQIHWFARKAASGDLLAFVSDLDQLVYLGVILGPYQHRPEHAPTVNRRKVRMHVARGFDQFSSTSQSIWQGRTGFFPITRGWDEFVDLACLSTAPSTSE
jgi:predicted Mrr-cat superfamily restriction endonuclease